MWHKIEVLGNLGADAEMKYTPSGQAVTSFSVAASRSYKKNEEWVKETVWFRCEAWGKTAEVCASLTKGARVFIVGRLKPDLTTGAPRVYQVKNGESKSSFEVVVGEIKLLDKKKDVENQESADEWEFPF